MDVSSSDPNKDNFPSMKIKEIRTALLGEQWKDKLLTQI